MQNRYVADIGDYVKLAILRRLGAGSRLGVAWWLLPDENHNNDGGHREYLSRPDEWRQFDPVLYDFLWQINGTHGRDVHGLEDESVLPNTVFSGHPVPCDELPYAHRPVKRREWLLGIKERFEGRNLIFLDPDNGIAPESVKATQRRSGKSVFIEDLQALKQDGQAIVLYCHQTHRKGGHDEELRYLAERLRGGGLRVCGALRAKPWSPRAFFILDGDEELINRARSIATAWDGLISWRTDI